MSGCELFQHGTRYLHESSADALDLDRSVLILIDALGHIVEDVGDPLKPVNGRDIELAIDSKVQFFAYQRIRDAVAEHKAHAGSVVVVDVQTGEILALANLPTFDPNQPGTNLAAFRNHVISDAFEPGSTFKIVTIGTALNDGKITLDEQKRSGK